MTQIILHHYPDSFFAEKIRRILAFKGLPWHSVEQPMIMPKPDLIALTGGYRRIPVLQIGADIYCDTACIARCLERLAPTPSILPRPLAGLAATVEDWADRRLVSLIGPSVVVARIPTMPPGFLEDRAAMTPGLSEKALRFVAPHGWPQALVAFDRLDAQLGYSAFLLGDAFTLADAACFHPLWFAKSVPALFEAVTARPALAAWFARIEAFGPGDAKAMTADEALAIARDSQPEDGTNTGDTVAITADDFGTEKTVGTLARLTADEITLHRHDPALGDIAVHFPRIGYRIQREQGAMEQGLGGGDHSALSRPAAAAAGGRP